MKTCILMKVLLEKTNIQQQIILQALGTEECLRKLFTLDLYSSLTKRLTQTLKYFPEQVLQKF